MATGTINFFNQDRGFGFIAGEDGKDYFLHISAVQHGVPNQGEKIEFGIEETQRGPKAVNAVLVGQNPVPHPRSNPHQRPAGATSPYGFVKRLPPKKSPPSQLHDQLNDDCFDIAFEVTWKALTPVAANPCTDLSDGKTCPPDNDDHYQGYEKRWLMVNNQLAISPFTVKSAIANGFASIMGSCYRVQNEIIAHKPESDKFQCSGALKRYRVGRNNSSPGILTSIDHETGDVEVQPVTEYYYQEKELPEGLKGLKRGDKCYVMSRLDNHKTIITRLESERFDKAIEVIYYAPYQFGMNLSFGPGEFNKRHHHRFFARKGKSVSGTINPLNLKSCEEQKSKVYMGVFRKFEKSAGFDNRTGYDGKPWHQDLSQLKGGKHGEWVYYQIFSD